DRLGSHWKTITGALAWAIGSLAGSPDVGVLGPGLAHWLQVAGEVLTALGLSHAAARAPGGPALAAVRPGRAVGRRGARGARGRARAPPGHSRGGRHAGRDRGAGRAPGPQLLA